METVYRNVFIKSKADLPKYGNYYVKWKDSEDISLWPLQHNKSSIVFWLKYIDWYLQPVELPSDEEIEILAEEEVFMVELPPPDDENYKQGLICGAKLMRNKLINK